MTFMGWLQILVYALAVLVLAKPLGMFMYRVFEGERKPFARVFAPLEHGLYRLCGVDPRREQTWVEYTIALLIFSAFGVLVTYAIQRLQARPAVQPAVAGRGGPRSVVQHRRELHHEHELAVVRRRDDAELPDARWRGSPGTTSCPRQRASASRWRWRAGSPGTFRADGPKTLGNFWVDLIRAVVYVLMPLSVVTALALVAGGRDPEPLALPRR